MKAETPPREVHGYPQALATGVVRPVPASPPPLLPGRTANNLFRMWLLSLAGGGLLWFVLYSGVQRIPSSHSGLRSLLLLTISRGVCFGMLAPLTLVGNRNVEEFAHGYTTLRLQLGSFYMRFSFTRTRRQQSPPWDYSGIWVLDDRGRVLAPPDPAVDPPGFFPSPNRPGQLELWTGVCWSGHFRQLPP
ncbi:MAG: hypothetical protein ABR549_11690 [Mycobacteriales bacterium]